MNAINNWILFDLRNSKLYWLKNRRFRKIIVCNRSIKVNKSIQTMDKSIKFTHETSVNAEMVKALHLTSAQLLSNLAQRCTS